MALPTSGLLKFTAIATELGLSLSNLSLRSMSNTAGFSIPDAVSEFYGYSNLTYTLYLEQVYDNEPCSPYLMVYDIYLGSDGKYYLNQGGTYVLVSDITSTWYYPTGMYIERGIRERDVFTYDVYRAIDGGFELYGNINSYCP